MSAIRVKHFSCWNTSVSFLVGKTPKVTMWCGKCSYQWSTRFSPHDFRGGSPRSLCPSCSTVNYVPLTVT